MQRAFDKLQCLVPGKRPNTNRPRSVYLSCTRPSCSMFASAATDIKAHSSPCSLWTVGNYLAVKRPDFVRLMLSLCATCSSINQRAELRNGALAYSVWGIWGRAGREGCDVLINKRQLCMMLTAGWSGPRHNPPQLLLTFQRPGAYPRRRAQSSLSRSSSVQGSGGGRPWPSLC